MSSLHGTIILIFLFLLFLTIVDTSSSHDGGKTTSVDGSADGSFAGSSGATRRSHVRRFRRSERANHTEFLPCLDTLPPALAPFIPDYRKTVREPLFSSLPCSPATDRCFRAVIDGYDYLLDADLSLKDIVGQVTEIFYQKGFVSRETPIQSSHSRHGSVHGGAAQSIDNLHQPYTGGLHGDYFELEKYVVTALLYNELPDDLKGGETVFADSLVSSIEDPSDGSSVTLQKGVIVEPKKGRLLMFSGGGENLHGPMPIYRKDQMRTMYTMFFECAQSDAIS